AETVTGCTVTPGVSVALMFTPSVSVPAAELAAQVMGDPACGVQEIVPRFARVPAPTFCTAMVREVGVGTVPPTVASNVVVLLASASTGWPISKVAVRVCGLLAAPAALTVTVPGRGEPVRPDGLAVRVSVLPETVQVSQLAGALQVIV